MPADEFGLVGGLKPRTRPTLIGRRDMKMPRQHFSWMKFAYVSITALIATTLIACEVNQPADPETSATNPNDMSSQTKPTPPPPATDPSPTATPVPPAGGPLKVAPLWEARRPEGRAWTDHSVNIVQEYGVDLMKGASDMDSFCPKFTNLADAEKVNFWIYLASAIIKYESDFDPTNRYVETTMGRDPITGQQVVSEGLMQLSYQDVLAYPFCNEFDWERDRNLSPSDPRKTILDPLKNLTCGLRILNYQIGHYGAIAIDRGQYWAVIKPSSRYNQLKAIQTLTKSLSFCR
jgi:hypothetical protein